MKPTLVQYDAPGWGVGEVWLDDDGRVFYSELPRPKRTSPVSDTLNVLGSRLAAFFAGEPDDFADVPLRIEDGFYGDCARALRAVTYGEVVTYGELAARSARPRAARAVGTVMNRNPLPIVLPCHRVIGSNGKLVGYGGGLHRKEALLRLEGALL
jgi:methylated-DNA-[protein]-cysteine S-methyltransferase